MRDCSNKHWEKTGKGLIILRAEQDPRWYNMGIEQRYEFLLDRCREYFQSERPHEPKDSQSTW